MSSTRDACSARNEYNNEHVNIRISSVFVVFVASAVGSFLPLIARDNPYFKLPSWTFFIIKYIGSGVIVSTAFIHLLAEAGVNLSDDCLGGVWGEYPWPEGLALMGVYTMFFFDIVAHKKISDRIGKAQDTKADTNDILPSELEHPDPKSVPIDNSISKRHSDCSDAMSVVMEDDEVNVYQQILNCFVLEFGIVFHSVFVGLSLAIAGDDFISLFIAIAFHQLLEGLGLGTRFALAKWPRKKQWVPWILSLAYSLTTPIAIAIGIGVRKSYPPGSRKALITNGVFNGLCSGILIYNSLVELMAYDFIFSPEFKMDKGMSRMLSAYFLLCVGGAAMALIGKWA